VPTQLLQARLEAASGQVDQALNRVQAVLAADAGNPEAWLLQAELASRLGRSAEAVAAYQRALAAQPRLVRAHSALIALHLGQRDLVAANTQLQALQKVAPQHPLTKLLEGQVAFVQGDLATADARFQQVLAWSPDNVLAMQSAGAVALRRNEAARAERLLARLLQLAPEQRLARRLLAQAQLQLGQAPRALATLGPLLDAAQPDVQALTLAAQVHLLTGQLEAADRLFQRAAALAPDNTRVRTALALSHLARGHTERTVAELQELAAADNGMAADLALVGTQMRQRNWPAALAAVQVLERKQPEQALPALLRGQVALARQDRAGARLAFEQALKRDAQNLAAVAALASLDLAERRPQDGLARFQALVRAQPGNPSARLALADMMRRGGAGRDAVAKVLDDAVAALPTERALRLALIDHHLATRQPQAALLAAQAALASLPAQGDDAELLLRLGRCQQATGAVQQAQASFSRVVTAQPGSVLGYLGLAEAQLAARQPAAASRTLRRALDLSPLSPPLLRLAIGAAVQQRQSEAALALARGVQIQQPELALGHLLEGEVWLAEQRWPEAVQALRRAQERQDPGASPARLHHALLQAGQPQEADNLAQQWRQSHPQDALFTFYLGDLALARQDWNTALRHYQAVLSQHPGHGLALNNAAWVLLQLRRPEALAHAEQAVRALPDHPAAMDTLAGALAAAGRHEQALAWSRRALAEAPEDPGLRLGLARVLLHAGKRGEAETELDALATLGQRFARQAEVRSLRQALAATR